MLAKISDKERYRTTNPDVDILPLGGHPDLEPLDKKYIRQALSMLDKDNVQEREIAAKFLLKRVEQYYKVIGYVGPQVTSFDSEIELCLGGWITMNNSEPYRDATTECNAHRWKNPEKVFNDVRYACFGSALRLAAWEVEQEVPESAEALKLARWVARDAIKSNTQRNWKDIRNRMGSSGMRKQLKHALKTIQSCKLIASGWLGYFSQDTI